MSEDEAALVAKFPMPEGKPDAVVNKKLLASALDVSTTTIDAWDLEGLPCVTKGTNGRSYEYRLSVAYAWYCQRNENETIAKAQSENAAAQLRMELVGGSTQDKARAALPIKEQSELLRNETEWMRAAALRRELVLATDMLQAVEDMLVTIRDGNAVVPDLIVREFGLDPAAAETIQDILDKSVQEASTSIREKFEGNT